VELDVLIQSQPSYRIKAQEWGRAFQDVGYTPQFRLPKPGEETRIEDLEIDGTPAVRIVCGMSADGTLRVANKRFTMARTQDLKAFLDELAQYGTGGPPEKDPNWGMSNEQLLELTRVLSQPVTEPIVLKSPLITIESIGLPEGIRMTFADSAREKALARRPDWLPETFEANGLSKGTAIAIVLAHYGLGFRPHRIAAMSYEIEVTEGDETSNLWPIGWKTRETTAVTLPAYLKPIPVDVEDAEVTALLDVVSERLKIPYYKSQFELMAADKDLDLLTYTRKDDKVSPSKLLSAIGDKLHLGFDIRVDEAGKLFLWATTSEQSTAFRTRFAHIKQQ
jgi:hypothetical protein